MNSFIPYGRQWIYDDDIEEVVKILKSNWLTTGPKVKEFEDKLCDYVGCKYGVAVNSGTSALDIAVHSLNLPTGSEIITTPFTFLATSNSIIYNNLKPLFADIYEDTRNINPNEIRKHITKNTRAIIYVDYAGHPCNIEEIKEIAEEHDLYLIEDACHAFGAKYEGKKVGNFADMTVFSFHPVKHITTGEGGAIVTNNEEFFEILKMLRNHGIDKDVRERLEGKGYAYDMKILGRNYRITDIQCALGISQMKRLDDFLFRRKKIVDIYNEYFEAMSEIKTPVVKDYAEHAWHIYTILLKNIDRNKFYNEIRKKNILANVHYIPIYHFSYYKKHFKIDQNRFPITENVFNRIITLPLYPKMNNDEIFYVIESVKKVIDKIKRK